MTRKNSQVNAEKIIIGMDIHPDVFTAAAFCGRTTESKQLWLDADVQTTDYRKWLARRAKDNVILVFEASANSFEFAEIAKEHGAESKVIDSRKIGQISNAYCETDKFAAQKIAKAYLSGLANKSEVWQPDETTRVRRETLSTYEQAVKNSTRSINQIRGFLNEHMVRLPKKFSFGARNAVEKIFALHDWKVEEKALIKIKMSNYLHAEATRKQLNTLIISEAKKCPVIKDLMQLCGIRAVIAFSIVATIGDITRFDSPKKLASYVGLVPGMHQSGNGMKCFGITNYGVRGLKSKLIQAAQSIMNSKNRSGSKLREWGVKLTFRKGKNAAVAAVARKLAVAIWYQMRGLMPAIMEEKSVLREKIRKIVAEADPRFLKAIGYESKQSFFEEFWESFAFKT